MKNSSTKSFTSNSQFDEQQFNSLLDKLTTKKQINISQFIDETKERAQKNVLNFQIRKNKNHIEVVADSALNKYTEIRENQLLQQIKELREDNTLLQNNFDILSKKYQQKRQQANQCLQQYQDVTTRYEVLSEKYINLEEEYRYREEKLINSVNDQIRQWQDRCKKQCYGFQCKIQQLQSQNKHLQQVIDKTEIQYEKVKQILELEKTKRKQKQKQNNEKIETFHRELHLFKQQVMRLKNQINEKNKAIYLKNQQLMTLEKTLREMNERVSKVKNQSQRQIMKQRAITKKAVDGLKMTRKYSQMQLSKSRKKQKQYLNNQKQLIGKIKQISKQQQSVFQATDKWQQKSSLRSLNTTLKLSKPSKPDVHPFVSNFMIEQESTAAATADLSPICKIANSKNFHFSKDNGLSKSRSTARLMKTRYKIDIPDFQSVEQCGIGTPCFQLQKEKIFPAKKWNQSNF